MKRTESHLIRIARCDIASLLLALGFVNMFRDMRFVSNGWTNLDDAAINLGRILDDWQSEADSEARDNEIPSYQS